MVITLRLNKNVLIAILLLIVFSVGTLTFTDTVEAAAWKKYDSGNYNDKNPDKGYKKKISYITYIKGSKDIKTNVYGYKTKNNKKTFFGSMYISKTGNKIKMYGTNSKGKKEKPTYLSYPGNVKQFYKIVLSEMKKG